MTKKNWKERLAAFKEDERPEAVLVVAGQAELLRIAVAWMQSEVAIARRLTEPKGSSDAEIWTWLWENALYNKAELLARIPNASARTARNFDALIATRVLYPDGTVNAFVARYLKERVVSLFAPGIRRRAQGVA